MIIAIDGPAASGKGTLARRLADHYGLRHLDTGLTYRAVAAALLARGLPLGDEAVAVATARNLDLSRLDRDVLSAHEIGEAASRIAVLPGLREELVRLQRRFAQEPPGAVLDGRDIGTVICPQASAKLFVTATPEVRAARRFKELTGRGEVVTQEAILADIRRRDARDSGRSDAPLKAADDAILLDTSALGIDEVLAAAIRIVESRRAG